MLRAWHFKQLRWSLQALADAGSGQPALFPERATTADELAFDFEHWDTLVHDEHEEHLTGAQREALVAIRAKLTSMSRDGAEFDLDLWTDAALRGSEHWADIRHLATIALETFDWSLVGVSESGPEPA
jgi:hypothetical protein